MPDELRSQVPIVRDLVAALGLPLLEATGYEADDVIGTIATAAERDGWEVHIVSGDLDMLQLVTKKVHLMHTAKGGADAIVEYDPERVFARYGLTPEQMVDFKSLKGDSSDNIPGVPGVGEKTASKLIATFGSLEQLYARLDEVEPVRIRESLAANRDAAFAGQGLMTIDRDAPLTLPATGGEIGVYDREAALALFRDLEFRALAQRLPPLAGEDRVAANAAVVASLAHLPWQAFGPGTEGGKSLPEIWKEMDKFKAGSEKMQKAVAELNTAAKSGNLETIKIAFGEAGKSCKACHDNYRKK